MAWAENFLEGWFFSNFFSTHLIFGALKKYYEDIIFVKVWKFVIFEGWKKNIWGNFKIIVFIKS